MSKYNIIAITINNNTIIRVPCCFPETYFRVTNNNTIRLYMKLVNFIVNLLRLSQIELFMKTI